ncbi:MAG: ABC transporter ATP-binding protein [Rhodothermaceae bacterium]
MEVIKFQKVKKSFKNSEFNLDVDELNVYSGKILTLLGPNGAGKTTLIKLLLDLIFPDNGQITILEKSHKDKTVRKTIGYLPEEFELPNDLIVKDFLLSFSNVSSLSKKTLLNQIDYLINSLDFQIDVEKKISALSKGNKQKVALIYSLLGNPNILIFDEPFNGLDPIQRSNMINYLNDLKNNGVTIIITTHILSDVEDISDEIAIIKAGKFIIKCTKNEALKQHTNLESFYRNYIEEN